MPQVRQTVGLPHPNKKKLIDEAEANRERNERARAEFAQRNSSLTQVGCDPPPVSRGEIEAERYRLAAALDVLRGVATDLTERISTACRSLPEVKPTAEFEQLETAIGTDLRRLSLQAEAIAAHLRMVCEAVEL